MTKEYRAEGIHRALRKQMGLLRRRARLLDIMQMEKPPYQKTDLAKKAMISREKVVKFLNQLVEWGVRVRLDYSIRGLDMKLVLAHSPGRWVERLPLIHWLSSAMDTPQGTSIFYKVPKEFLPDVLETLRRELGENAEIFVFEEIAQSRPELEYYLTSVDSLDPQVALKLNEDHPKSYERDLWRVVYHDPKERVFRDGIDLALLASGEANVLAMRSLFRKVIEALYKGRKPDIKFLLHLSHVLGTIRGSKVMLYDKSNLMVSITGVTSTKCQWDLLRFMYTYLYSTSLAFSEEGALNVVLSLPHKYSHKITLDVARRCHWDHLLITINSLGDVRIRRTLPYRSFDYRTNDWSIEPEKVDERYLRRGYTLTG